MPPVCPMDDAHADNRAFNHDGIISPINLILLVNDRFGIRKMRRNVWPVL